MAVVMPSYLKEFDDALRKITMMGYGLIMTCHLKENADDDGKIIGYKPDLNNPMP